MYADPRKKPGIKRPYIPLPAVTAPAGEVCITIPVPDHPDHKRALLGVLQLLGSWHSWERTGTDEGAQAAAVWKEKLERIDWNGGDCVLAEADQCVDYMPSSSRIDYEPANPFTEPGTVPPGYVGEPFTIVKETDSGLLLLGFQVGDVMTDLTRYPGGATAPEIIASGLPRFILTYTAPAEIEFHFVQFPGGGRALIRRDFDINPLAWTTVELNKDLVGLPFETVTEIVIEFNDEDTGVHTYEVTFLPSVDDSIPFIYFGGGLRKITICNEGGEEFVQTKIRLNPDNNCIIQASYDNELTWADVIDLENTCGPDVRRIRQNPDNPCQIEYSPFGEPEEGEEDVWFVVGNFSLCKPTLRWRGGILEWFDGDDWIPFDITDPLYDNPPPPVPRPEEEPNDRRCSSAASATYSYLELASRLHTILDPAPSPLFAPTPISVAASLAGVASDVLNFFHGSDAFTNLAANLAFQVNATGYIGALYVEAAANLTVPALQLITNLGLTDPDTRDRLKCALYCITGDAGTIPPDEVAEALDNAIANDGLASGWTAFVNLFGAGGVNAASSVGAFSVPASDCDCDCPTCEQPITFNLSECYALAPSVLGAFDVSTLDTGFGNPSPSAKSANGSSGGFSGYAIRVGVPLTSPQIITGVSFDYYWNGTANPSNVLAQHVYLYDADDILLATWFEPSDDGQAQNTWHNRSVSISASNVSTIVIDIGVVGGGTGAIWIDNIEWEPVIYDLQDEYSDPQSPLVSGGGRDVTGTEFYIDDTGLHGGGQA